MKTILLAALLACAGLRTHAQVYYLELGSQQLVLPTRTVGVEQVLDGRDGHQAIGLAYRGLANKPTAVLFRQGLGTDLTAFAHTWLPVRPSDHPVVLCVRQLRVSEVLGGLTEQASADLALDVYVHLSDGYHFVQSTGAHTSDRGLETTKQHAAHLALLLGQCLGQLAQADWTAATAQPARTLDQLPTDMPTTLTGGGRRGPVPAILRQAPRRGVYYRFEQFLANAPDTSQAFRLDTIRPRYKSQLAQAKWRGVGRVRPLLSGAAARRPTASLWGFSDGQQLFVQHNKHFYPLTRQRSFFTFVGEAPLDLEYARAAAEAQVRASALGVATVRAPDHTGEPAAFSLDMRTGELAPYPGLYAATRRDTAYVYVYRPALAAGPAAVKVFLNGREAGSLRPGEYLELPWDHYAQPLQLCLTGVAGSAPCQYLVPNTARRNYLKVAPTPTGHAWQWVPASRGEADLDELDEQHK